MEQTRDHLLAKVGQSIGRVKLTEPPALPRCERCGLRLTSVVVQSSDPRWAAAPHLAQTPDQTSRPDRTTDVIFLAQTLNSQQRSVAHVPSPDAAVTRIAI
jgi:hypothetical protein